MKKYFILCSMVMLAGISIAQQVVKDDFESLVVSFQVNQVGTASQKVNGQTFTILNVEGYIPPAVVGAPNLPLFSTLVEVPLCREFNVELTDVVYDTIALPDGASSPLMPVQPSYSKSDRGQRQFEMDGKVYSTDEYYRTDQPVMMEAVGIARDRRLARLQFAPFSYNPVKGFLVVCRQATVTVHYVDADVEGTQTMFERYYSPAFVSGAMSLNSLYPKNVSVSAPIRYLIVAHSMFRGQLDDFVQWKRRKGFLTDIVYTDDAAVGSSSSAIQSYIQSQYANATTDNPAPTYLLLVGDHEQIPAFTGTASSSHITDLYYVSWTSGDNLPDCYTGRFSAQSVSQLTPQVEKTLMYEQYTFADPSFLDRAVMVAGVDGGSSGDYGYTHADPAMDYAITNYINSSAGWSQVSYFKNNTSIVPSATGVTLNGNSDASAVRSLYNQGAGWINYSAHGSATSWYSPSFTTSHAETMTNTQKFGVMIGNCCLTNKFETTTCLGEAVLRKGNYCGAVGYIGGTNSTYWNEDVYWAVGLRSSISASMSMAYDGSNLGVYDRLCHTHGETYNQWAMSLGSIIYMGNLAVQSSSSSLKLYYWEIYELMGDPSLMPYLTQPSQIPLTAPSTITVGTSSISVSTAPYAYIAITDTVTRTLRVSGFADASGSITLTLPSSMGVGGYEIAATAQQYRTVINDLNVIAASGPYVQLVSVTPQSPLTPGTTTPLTVKVFNPGNSVAHNVAVSLGTNGSALTLGSTTLNIASIAVGDTATCTVNATVAAGTADQTTVSVTASATWTGCTTSTTGSALLTIVAPVVTVTTQSTSRSLLPGSDLTITVTVANSGHATLASSSLTLTSSHPQLTVTPVGNAAVSLAAGASVTRQFMLHAASSMPLDLTVPLYLFLEGSLPWEDTITVYVGENSFETFEGGLFNVDGWTQGTYPWQITDDEAYQGTYSARSYPSLSHSQTSEMSISLTLSSPDTVSFWYKVSSESNYDKFHFYIDNDEKVVSSGQVEWTRAAFLVTAGSHTLLFSYSKDVSVSSYSDCAWIDNVSLPHPLPSYNVTVTAVHGTATGSGTYLQGETATVGVYPQSGYAFTAWNDGNTSNPRQFTVTSSCQLTATLIQDGGEVVTVHDTVVQTAFVNIHDTTWLTQYDTTWLTQYDTIWLTQYDTTWLTQYDTTWLTQYDTVYVDIFDTLIVSMVDTIVVMDTLTITEYIDVFVHDTSYVDVLIYDTVYQTDTLIFTNTIYDTVTNTVYDTVANTVYDTTILYVYDTLWLYDTVYIHDTVYVPVEGISELSALNVKIYQQEGYVVIEGAEEHYVEVYDVAGRRLESATGYPVKVPVPTSGLYLVKVDGFPARRIVVVR